MGHERILEEYEYYTAQAEAVRRSIEVLSASVLELNMVKEGLEEIRKLSRDNEVLIPVGGSSFVRARITDTEEIIIGIGANVAAKKSILEAEEYLQTRIKELEKIRLERGEQLKLIIGKVEEIVPQLEKIVAESEKEG